MLSQRGGIAECNILSARVLDWYLKRLIGLVSTTRTYISSCVLLKHTTKFCIHSTDCIERLTGVLGTYVELYRLGLGKKGGTEQKEKQTNTGNRSVRDLN